MSHSYFFFSFNSCIIIFYFEISKLLFIFKAYTFNNKVNKIKMTLNFKQFNKKGIVLNNTYEIINEIGQGGFSIVYLVNHKLTDET